MVTSELKKMTAISKSFNMYKPMGPSQIMASEKRVAEVIRVLEQKYINPFGLGPDELLNPSSGESVDAKLAKSILNVCKDGKKMRDEFIQSRIKSKSKKFHDPLKRCTINTFNALSKFVAKDVPLADPKADQLLKDVKKDSIFVIDLLAAIRTMTNLPETYEDFSWHFVGTLSKGF